MNECQVNQKPTHHGVVADFDTDATVVAIRSLRTDQPCRTRSEIGIPSEATQFNKRPFTSASTC